MTTLAAAPATLRLYGECGLDFTADDVASALTAAGGRPITVSIFSYGGDAGSGLACAALLARYAGKVTVVIDGVAASAASVIAVAGDRVVIAPDGLLMLHDCWSKSSGNAASMRSTAALLDTYSASYRSAYSRKSGASEEQVIAWMAAGNGDGTWFTAQEALAAGLVDEVAVLAAVRAQAPQLPSGRFSAAPAALAIWTTDQVKAQSTETNNEPMTAQSVQPEASAAELRRENDIRRCAAQAKLSPDAVEALVANGKPFSEVALEIVSAHAAGLSQSSAGHPARISTTNDSTGSLEAELTRALSGQRLDQPLWLSLRAAGIGKGSDATAVWASALAGEGRWLARGAGMSTGDLPNLLTSTGNRRLMEKFTVAEAGIRLAASVRQLQDYRAAGVIDAGTIGTAKQVLEGGEVTFTSVNETAATYAPSRYALGLSFTPQMLANDDLSALDTAISELAEAMLDTEASALVDLLEGAALGRNAPDGLALFHANHSNVVTGGITIATIGTAVAKLRNQKSLGGRYIAQEPAAIIVGPDQETNVRQLLSGAIQAAQASNVNPWSNLEIAVEPRLSGSFAYVIGSGRKSLELGRLTSGPVMTTEVDFSTSCYRAKSEHVFGAIIAEHRSIVRIATA